MKLFLNIMIVVELALIALLVSVGLTGCKSTTQSPPIPVQPSDLFLTVSPMQEIIITATNFYWSRKFSWTDTINTNQTGYLLCMGTNKFVAVQTFPTSATNRSITVSLTNSPLFNAPVVYVWCMATNNGGASPPSNQLFTPPLPANQFVLASSSNNVPVLTSVDLKNWTAFVTLNGALTSNITSGNHYFTAKGATLAINGFNAGNSNRFN